MQRPKADACWLVTSPAVDRAANNPTHTHAQIGAASSSGATALTLAAGAAERPGGRPYLLEALLAAGAGVGAAQGRDLLRAALAARWDEVAAQVGHAMHACMHACMHVDRRQQLTL